MKRCIKCEKSPDNRKHKQRTAQQQSKTDSIEKQTGFQNTPHSREQGGLHRTHTAAERKTDSIEKTNIVSTHTAAERKTDSIEKQTSFQRTPQQSKTDNARIDTRAENGKPNTFQRKDWHTRRKWKAKYIPTQGGVHDFHNRTPVWQWYVNSQGGTLNMTRANIITKAWTPHRQQVVFHQQKRTALLAAVANGLAHGTDGNHLLHYTTTPPLSVAQTSALGNATHYYTATAKQMHKAT
jgi:hypothetical protein